jgi:hypothetical protein
MEPPLVSKTQLGLTIVKFSTPQSDEAGWLLPSPLYMTCHRHSPGVEARNVAFVVLYVPFPLTGTAGVSV